MAHDHIAGICNASERYGLMPPSERACEDLLGSSDADVFRSLAGTLAAAA